MDYKTKIREVPDFPTPGITFYDIMPLLQDARMFRSAVDELIKEFKNSKIQKVVGIDARGFLLAAPVAYALGAGFAAVRKKGKLPHEVIRTHHELEYGRAAMEIQRDAILPGERVVIIDDVLATGGTIGAAVRLVERLGGNVAGIGFLLEIEKFKAREKLNVRKMKSVVIV